MNTSHDELGQLREEIGELARRIAQIERALNISAVSTKPEQPVSTPPPVRPTVSSILSSPPQIKSEPPDVGGAPREVKLQPPVAPPQFLNAPVRGERSLESTIGSQWLNRVGISAVLIGVSYFLKFAFDNNWIGPSGRIAIGLLAGIAVVVWSERFRSRGYQVFSYSLKAVGIGVLYLSLWAAFQMYSLVPSGVAFAAMLVVTAATATMALTQDAQILAALALVGGFATPLLLSTGQNREVALFSYVAVLDLGALAMMFFKPWRRLLLLSFAGTLLLYIGWYSQFYDRRQIELTVEFATLFFATFAVAPLVVYRSKVSSQAYDFLLPLSLINAGVYFIEIYVMVSDVSETSAAWFAIALAAVYILLSRVVAVGHTNAVLAEKQRLVHLALAIGFITIAIPIRLDAHWITLGWFVEAAVLLWVADRIHSDLLNVFALAALGLGIVRLLIFDNFYSTQLLWNARMATYAVAIAVLGAVAWYGSRRKDDAARNVAAAAVVALNLLALLALSREISDYFSRQIAVDPYRERWGRYSGENIRRMEIARDFSYSALWISYGGLLMVIGFLRNSAFVRWQALALIAVTTCKVFAYDTSQLDRIYRILSFIALGVLLLVISFAYQRDWLKLSVRKAALPATPPT